MNSVTNQGRMETMLTADATTVDEQSTLSSLDTVIQKRQEAARGREVLSEQYRQLIVCEAEERKAVQQLDELEGRLKAVTKSSLLGTVKPGEVYAVPKDLPLRDGFECVLTGRARLAAVTN